jgi:dethiobiotin synthetase
MIVVVTGTDTGVGKTVVTAALAARAMAAGHAVAMLKPAQTGTAAFEPSEITDAETVARLAGPEVTTLTIATFPDPLSPHAAAQVAGAPELYLGDVLEAVAKLAQTHDLVLVEGAGGALVPMGHGAWTIADAAIALRAPAVVVARAGLGTLNHTALTTEALRHRGIANRVVIGAWPARPELVHERNLIDLGLISGQVPEGAGSMDPRDFQAAAPGWFTEPY